MEWTINWLLVNITISRAVSSFPASRESREHLWNFCSRVTVPWFFRNSQRLVPSGGLPVVMKHIKSGIHKWHGICSWHHEFCFPAIAISLVVEFVKSKKLKQKAGHWSRMLLPRKLAFFRLVIGWKCRTTSSKFQLFFFSMSFGLMWFFDTFSIQSDLEHCCSLFSGYSHKVVVCGPSTSSFSFFSALYVFWSCNNSFHWFSCNAFRSFLTVFGRFWYFLPKCFLLLRPFGNLCFNFQCWLR